MAHDAAPVFVFGSNTSGRHGKGAALWAVQHRGAIEGQGEGLQGNAYAIPTRRFVGRGRLATLPLGDIESAAQRFIAFARAHPELRFQLTPIGCGLAGYSPAHIAPMFADVPPNISVPQEFKR